MATTPVTPTASSDPWLDPNDQFAPLDTRPGGTDLMEALGEIAGEHPELVEEPTLAPAPAAPVETTAPPAPAAEPEANVVELEDGSTVEIEKTTRGWKATLTSAEGGQPEVFYGRTQQELLGNVAAGKLKATQKIRALNREIKLGGRETAAPAAPPAPATPAQSTLTADQLFEIKTQLQSNPDLALEKWFQLRTGLSVQQLVQMAQEGKAAKDDLDVEGVSRAFLNQHPEYLVSEKNYKALIAWLAKNKLGRVLTKTNGDEIMTLLCRGGQYTVENLSEAYEDLLESGLLETGPAAEEETPETPAEEPPSAPAPVPAARRAPAPAAPADERIVRTVRRPRAGLGVHARETTASPAPENPQPPSVDDLDNLSDEQIAELMAGVRRTKAQSGRR